MAMKTFNVGDVLGAADLTEYLENTRFAVKAADTSRSSNVTLTNDPDLSVTADANKIYEMTAAIAFVSPTAAGFKFDFTVPSGTVFNGTILVTNGSNGAVSAIAYNNGSGQLGVPINPSTVTSAINSILLTGFLDTAGTAGNVVFQWAQGTSNASATIVNAGSGLRLRRVS